MGFNYGPEQPRIGGMADALKPSSKLSSSTEATRPKTAFVFAGGGSFGAVQVGMLRALVAHGLKADMVR